MRWFWQKKVGVEVTKPSKLSQHYDKRLKEIFYPKPYEKPDVNPKRLRDDRDGHRVESPRNTFANLYKPSVWP